MPLLKVINLWAGPGAGKSTTAAGLFFEMKQRNMKVELVTEYAKELAYQETLHLTDQWEIFQVQAKRLRILEGKVDWAITDSPSSLVLVYGTPDQRLTDAVRRERARHKNFDFFISRCKPYQTYGRDHSEKEAIEADLRADKLFSTFGSLYVKGDAAAPLNILRLLGVSDIERTAATVNQSSEHLEARR